MANVVHPPIDFYHGPAAPNLGFGFGMSSPASKTVGGWQQQSTITLGHSNPAAFQQLASTMSQSSPTRAQKRRHEPEDEDDSGRHGLAHATTTGSRDDAMDRSPTPERPKKAPPKRARVMNVVETGNKEKGKENKPPGAEDGGDVDVGVLLGEFDQPIYPIKLLSLIFFFSELTAAVFATITDRAVERATFAEICHPTFDTTTHTRNGHPSTSTVCQETARCIPILQLAYIFCFAHVI